MTRPGGYRPRARAALLACAAVSLGLALGPWPTPATAQDDPEKPAGDDDGDRARDGAGDVQRFSHADHADRGVELQPCSRCHQLDSSYRAGPATRGNDHQPCADSGCHFDEFFARAPDIDVCSVCHEGREPWVAQSAVLRQHKRSEFAGSGLSHKAHTGLVKGGGTNGTCKRCHGDKFAGQNKPPRGGHSACAPCHARNAQPGMDGCDACHKLDGEGGVTRAAPSEWSVRDNFDHTTHGKDPRSSRETACVGCHVQIPEATTLTEVEPPRMKDCDGCHDGNHAFKTTGFECYKCHETRGE